jgi:hypothetical protein
MLCDEAVVAELGGAFADRASHALRNYAIGFYPSPGGTFDGTHVEVGGDVCEVQGRIVRGVLDAEVDNPPCEHHWPLEK